MKRYKYLLLLFLSVLAIGAGIVITKNANSIKQNIPNRVSNTQDSVNIYNVIGKTIQSQSANIKDSVRSNWKTYTNNNLSVTFKYPDTWTKNGEESNAINRTGEVMSISVNFIDTVTQSVFSLAYNVSPYGPEVYKIEEDQFNSSKNSDKLYMKKNIVAGNIAIESFTTKSKDIKGNIYDPALKLIHIVFLDKQKTGAFNLNFKTPAPDSEREIAKFKQLISTFKFINKD